MMAIAYTHLPQRVVDLAEAFAAGCRKHNVPCQVRRVEDYREPEPGARVIWIYGLGATKAMFDGYAGSALRVIGDVGYWRELRPRGAQEQRHVRISLNAQQPDAHLRLRFHPADRFNALQLSHQPVIQRGEPILVCGYSAAQAAKFGCEYGEWERKTVERLQAITSRPIMVREKPRNPLFNFPGTIHCDYAKCWEAIRKSWAVVCRSGNIGADAVLHGVPVWAEQGPGAVYGFRELELVETAAPLSPEARQAALNDLAYWQWTYSEIANGELWAHLREERLL